MGMAGGVLDGEGSLQMLPGKSSCIGILGNGFVVERLMIKGSLSKTVSTREISEFEQELRGSG